MQQDSVASCHWPLSPFSSSDFDPARNDIASPQEILNSELYIFCGLDPSDLQFALSEAAFVQEHWFAATDPTYTCPIQECTDIMIRLSAKPMRFHSQRFRSKARLANDLSKHLAELEPSVEGFAEAFAALPDDGKESVREEQFKRAEVAIGTLLGKVVAECEPWWESAPGWGDFDMATRSFGETGFRDHELMVALQSGYDAAREESKANNANRAMKDLEQMCGQWSAQPHLFGERVPWLQSQLRDFASKSDAYSVVVIAIEKIKRVIEESDDAAVAQTMSSEIAALTSVAPSAATKFLVHVLGLAQASLVGAAGGPSSGAPRQGSPTAAPARGDWQSPLLPPPPSEMEDELASIMDEGDLGGDGKSGKAEGAGVSSAGPLVGLAPAGKSKAKAGPPAKRRRGI